MEKKQLTLTISPNKKQMQIFLASKRQESNAEMLAFIATLKMSINTTFECTADRTAVSCIIKCADEEEFDEILKQLQEREEVKYIIEP